MIALQATTTTGASGLDIFVAVLTAIATAPIIFIPARALLRRLVFRRMAARRRVERVCCEVSLSWYVELLGQPQSRHLLPEISPGVEEVLFVSDYYVVQAITMNDRVIQFAVVSRRKSFRPRFVFWDGVRDRLVVLQRSSFCDLPEGDIFVSVGARRFTCFESVYLGNPGLYQTRVWGWHEMSQGDGLPDLAIEYSRASEAEQSAMRSELRRTSRVSLYGETSPGQEVIHDPPWMGGDSDSMRVWREGSPRSDLWPMRWIRLRTRSSR